jgi:acyl carrier protein
LNSDDNKMDIEKFVKNLLKQQLQLGGRVDDFTSDTLLLGALPEMDSMGVVNIITALEEQIGCTIEDDEIDAEVFATFGSLVEFVSHKS